MIRELVQGILADYEGKKLTRKMIQNATTRIVAALTMLRHDAVVTDIPKTIEETPSIPPPVAVPSTPVVEAPASPKDEPAPAVSAKVEEVQAAPEVVEVGERKAIVSAPPKKARNNVIVALPIGTLGTSLDPKTGAVVDQDVGVFVVKSE